MNWRCNHETMWMMKSSSQILIICLIDEEIENLYSARDIVVKRMIKDEYFNMDNQKWDEMIKEAVQHGYLKDTNECEEILEDMLSWDKLLPGDRQLLQARFNKSSPYKVECCAQESKGSQVWCQKEE
ncbi:hypothetical protein ERO13_D10G144200v2 [Gossypium hirsutum]|uniref:Uncharacterized protein LOC107914897 n=1 Tax=Gossypium hirsutum TaxID=3635 RepID=A0A1U8KEP6_GOSHI|nr:uncharacterized protein LOC107914897 [Gossypium hirsutum]XP_016699438.1 uncharacterized protein LOC107914897 [Gossypium hirsutum]KAG4126234.1 hypothetical protein ERO13_D10G144200v2 [Gossypium hirsutum]KAG4126235.1 hypothetical protein ERO13_D10G144200v2 [Gossypium hirsutum]